MLFTIAVTHFNKGRFLYRALQSVYNQISEDVEVIVLDDCSNDPVSIECFLDCRRNFDSQNFIFLENEINSGNAYSKNRVISEARGEIIIHLDGDDELPEGAVEAIKNEFIRDSSIDVLFGNYLLNKKLVDCSKIVSSEYLDPCKLARNWIILGASPMKKALIQRVGGYRLKYGRVDDVEFFRRLIVEGYKFKYLRKTIYHWNRDDNGVNHSVRYKDHGLLFFRTLKFNYRYLPRSSFFYQVFRSLYFIMFNK